MVDRWPNEFSGYSMIAFDLPGHGGSGNLPPGGYSIAKLSVVIGSILKALSIDEPVLVGHSLGASVALALSHAGTTRPRATTLIDLNPDSNHDADTAISDHIDMLIGAERSLEDLVRSICERLPLVDIEIVRQVFSHMAYGSDDRCRLRLDPEIKQLVRRSAASDEWLLLQSLHCPLAIVRGQYSGVLGRPVAERMSQVTRRPAGLDTIGRSGHAIPLEQPAKLAAALESQIARILL